jgi:Tfp pilus assembly protein PilX
MLKIKTKFSDLTMLPNKFKSQQGAVLAFSLLMLLLLTLAGTRMIQQNKQQLEMAGNARLLTQEFANAEGLLANAKTTINTWPQHVDPAGTAVNKGSHQCVTTSGTFLQNIGSAGSITGSGLPASTDKVTILEASCMQTKGGIITPCTTYNAGVITCHPQSGDVDCTTKTSSEIAALFSGPNNICYQPYDPSCSDERAGSDTTITTSLNIPDNYNPNPRCRMIQPNPMPAPSCSYELYTIKSISTDANGTTREIISDHVVGCGS